MKLFKKVLSKRLGLMVVVLSLLFGAGLLFAAIPPAPSAPTSSPPPAPSAPTTNPPPAPPPIVIPPPPPLVSCIDDFGTGGGTCAAPLGDSCCEFLTCVDSDPQLFFTCYLSPPPENVNGNGPPPANGNRNGNGPPIPF